MTDASMTTITVPFVIGQHVILKPLDHMPGRVTAFEIDRSGLLVLCRYIHDGKIETGTFFADEIEVITP